MPENTKKNQDNVSFDNRFLNGKILNCFNNPYFSIYCQNFTQTMKLKPNQTLFDRKYSNLISLFF